ncbi:MULTISPECIES: hypothetical protein [Spiroplasma]|uniref:Uncharacterized protein n=2 Tax=Spiroplasma TaxID=2132 RepID=W0GQP4_9MOLU|nr:MULTISPECIES: hypothetical protein [Spiroplasma]AHF58206.1 hypothetical protein SPE_1091 [Spiroplasma eriocheiris CCTCC M 207170]AHF61418.1 hypothetical protein SMM_1044 [Spiroplasma mirum ATCC 29335]AHI58552.1 hypothetical protein P344_06225 [Spiroplasma mirum ATCC 29335]AKM53469.1 hypothetical protein SATRI_v1c11160 [Spiroplasma atrichopogonis]AKM54641.1 hypothetical protein SERIO_v1c10880 [Spiroplasma eriocheiris]
MLPEKIDSFIEDHVDKPLSEYIKENPRFILEFINTLSWEEKFELINDYVAQDDEIEHAINTINKKISLFIEDEIKERVIQNISEEEYLRHKAIVEVYEKAKAEYEQNKKSNIN